MAGRPNVVPTGHHFCRQNKFLADGHFLWPMASTPGRWSSSFCMFVINFITCVDRMFCLHRPHVLLAWTAFLCSNSLLAPCAPLTCLCLHSIVMLPTCFALSRIFKGNCRHPIFDRPQDLDVTIGTLGDHPCLCSS
ncbi:hypothetical protein CsSME_00028483 [Camellia sinensis var. sinensis]